MFRMRTSWVRGRSSAAQRIHYGLDGPGFESLYGKGIFLFSTTFRPPLGPKLFNGHRGSFTGVKRPGRELNHSSPSSTYVKNEWCLHGVDRKTFTFFYFEFFTSVPIPLAARSKAWVCGRWARWNCGFESHRGHECLLWLSGRGLCDGLITRPEESYRLWCVVECDLETSCMRRSWPTGGCRARKKQKIPYLIRIAQIQLSCYLTNVD